MPITGTNVQPEAGLEHDHEHWPADHYRGRGNDQSNTGPNGPWLEGQPAAHMRAPEARRDGAPAHDPARDERIAAEVREALRHHGDIDAETVDVHVDDGDVTLRGTVRSHYAKQYAVGLATAVDGVGVVFDALAIEHDENGVERGGPTTDGRS